MKASKLVVLVGGILGIIAFFLPLVSVHRADFHGTASAYQIVRGLHQAQTDLASATDATSVSAKGDLGAIKGIVLAVFAPAVLLALIGGLGVARKKFGRGAGVLSLLLGLVGLGIAALLKSAAEGDAGIGLTFLLLTGVGGVVGGVMAIAKPQRREMAAQPTAFATAPRLAA